MQGETYTCEELLSREELPHLVKVEHIPTDLQYLFHQDDILEVCGVHNEICVHAEYLFMKNEMKQIFLPLSYPGGVKHLCNFEFTIPTAQTLKKMFSIYESRFYRITKSKKTKHISLPKGSIIEIKSVDDQFLHVSHQNKDKQIPLKIPLEMNCDFIEVPIDQLISLKDTVEKYLLPRWVRFDDVNLLTSICRGLNDMNGNVRLLYQTEQKVLMCKVKDAKYNTENKMICFPCNLVGKSEFKFSIVQSRSDGLIADKELNFDTIDYYDFILALNENCSVPFSDDDKKNKTPCRQKTWKHFIPEYDDKRKTKIFNSLRLDVVLSDKSLPPDDLEIMSNLQQPFLRAGSPTELDPDDDEVNNNDNIYPNLS